MSDEKYNGWANYETWNYALWLDNDQGSYEYWQERAIEAYADAEACDTFTREENATFALRDMLKEEADEFASQNCPGGSSWMADAVNSYLGSVDWQEIAEHYISDVDKEEEETD